MAIPKLIQETRKSLTLNSNYSSAILEAIDVENDVIGESSLQLQADTANGERTIKLAIDETNNANLEIQSSNPGIVLDSCDTGGKAFITLNDVMMSVDNNTMVYDSPALSLNNAGIKQLADPSDDQDAATKHYVDTAMEDAGGIFYAQYGTTTYQEVQDAIAAGKTVIARDDFYNYQLAVDDAHAAWGGYVFTASESGTIYQLLLTGTKSWEKSEYNQPTVAQYWYASTPLSSSTGYYRPIRVSTAAPTASDGNVGDIWIQYSV